MNCDKTGGSSVKHTLTATSRLFVEVVRFEPLRRMNLDVPRNFR